MASRNTSAGGPVPTPDLAPLQPVLIGGALIALAAIAAYGRTLGCPFVLDDAPSIVDNPSIRHWGSALWAPPDTTAGGRPLLNLSLALNYAIGGTNVAGYHALNLAIHILAALTLFGILRRTFALLPAKPAFHPLLPLAITLIWTLHPLQTESVTYTIQRAESLMGLFYLLTLYFFIRSIGSDSLTQVSGFRSQVSAKTFQVFSVASCLCCVATKEVSATLPILLLLYDRTFAAGSFREAWARRRKFHLCLMATWIPLAALVLATHGRASTAGFGSGVSVGAYARDQLAAVPHYLRLCLWPSPLVFDYGTSLGFPNSRVAAGAAVLISLAAATGWALVRRPAAGFLGACFFVILAPSSSVIPVATEPMAEHRMYLPLAAVAVAFAAGLHALLGRRSLPALLALAAVLGWATVRRNSVYADEEGLWRDTLAKCPSNERARNNLGNVLAGRAGRLDDAIAEYREAVRLRPTYAEAQFNLGCALERSAGGTGEAIAAYRSAIALKPDFAEAHNNLGNALEKLPGSSPEAITQFEAAVRLNPGYAEARNNLGGALLDVPGRLGDATDQIREALRLQPANPAAHVNLAVALLMTNVPAQADEAVSHLREALRLQPGNPAARGLLERMGQPP